jgi:hypothetical protein
MFFLNFTKRSKNGSMKIARITGTDLIEKKAWNKYNNRYFPLFGRRNIPFIGEKTFGVRRIL